MLKILFSLSLLPIYVLFALVIIFSFSGQFQFTIILVIISSIFFYFFDRTSLLILYIILLPTNGIFLKEYNLFGIINIDIITNLLTLIFLFQTNRKNVKQHPHQKIVIAYIAVILLYVVYVEFKDVYFNIGYTNYARAISRSIYLILKYAPLLFLIRITENLFIKDSLLKGINLAAIFLFLSVLLTPYLHANGFKVSGLEYETSVVYRYSGFFGSGDTNSVGAFFAILIGFYLSRIEKIKRLKGYSFLLLISVITIFVTASRTSIIALGILVIIYALRNFKHMHMGKLLLLASFVLIVFSELIFSSLTRFETTNEQLQTEVTTNRIGKWILYMEDIADNPSSLLYGSSEGILADPRYSKSLYKAAHNLYIQITHNAGLIFPILILLIYIKFLILTFSNNYKYSFLYYILPFLLITMTVSDLGAGIYLYFFIALNEIQPQRKIVSFQ